MLENNVEEELSTSILVEKVLVDSALLTRDVVFSEPLAMELIACIDRRLDKLAWVAIAVRLLVRYSSELGEVTCPVGVFVIDGVVWIIVEFWNIETPFVVETLATDTLGLRSGEEVMLRFILLLEMVTMVVGLPEVVDITKVEGLSTTGERLNTVVLFSTLATELEILDNILLKCNVCRVWERKPEGDVEFDRENELL